MVQLCLCIEDVFGEQYVLIEEDFDVLFFEGCEIVEGVLLVMVLCIEGLLLQFMLLFCGLIVGKVCFEVCVGGDIDCVVFLFDGCQVFLKCCFLYSVEFDFGEVLVLCMVCVVGYFEGVEVVMDQFWFN